MTPESRTANRPDAFDPAVAGQTMLELAPAELARRLRALDWSFDAAPLREHTHGLHPYPAKFVPDLPRRAIELLSEPGDLVLDPFSGGGTAGLEAILAGRRFHGIDANPVGNLIARAKTTPPAAEDLRALRDLEAALLALGRDDLASIEPSWLPPIPNRHKWYDDHVFRGLGVIRDLVVGIEQIGARNLAFVAFIQAATRLSFQESETRYTSKPRAIDVIEVPRTVVGELRRIRRVSEALQGTVEEAQFVDGDARDPSAFSGIAAAVGLIVTSPPYPNTYDYHLYHRFRLFWLGQDPTRLRRVEIGCHLTNQACKDPRQSYVADMRAVLDNCRRVIAPGRYIVLVVGDGLFEGELFETALAVTAEAHAVGLEHVVTISRPLPQNRRSVTKPGRRLATEQVVVLRQPGGDRSCRVCSPNYALFPYERELQLRELDALGGSPQVESTDEVRVAPSPHLVRAAFTHAIQLPDGDVRETLQYRLEGAPVQASRRKNSTYFAHGIHRYKGKFYPQLAKCLLNLSGLEVGESLVADPFGGSGTVALEAILNGIDAVSIDCNPVGVAIAEAKIALATMDAGALRLEFAKMRRQLADAPPGGNDSLTQFEANTLTELDRWFPEPVISKLDWLLRAVRTYQRPTARVFEVLVSDLVREVSQQEPKDLRIRRRKDPISDAPVYDLFLKRLHTLDDRLTTFVREVQPTRPRAGSAAVIYGDSGDPATFAGLDGRTIDAVISSPPYAAALPYIDTDRLSLAVVFGYGGPSRRPLEETMIGSREITERDRVAYEAELVTSDHALLPESTIEFLTRYRAAVASDSNAGFRRRQAPAVLFRYFQGMRAVLANVVSSTTRGASCWLVLGDSRSTIGGRRWTIPTVDEVAAIGKHVGLRLVDRIPITVTREDVLHSRHTITRNEILHLQA